MATLHRILEQHRDEIIAIWIAAIGHEAAGIPVTTIELVDHMPRFVDELTEALVLIDPDATKSERKSTAAKHGIQRFRLGFDLDAVVREYGTLHRCIIEFAHRDSATITYEEHRVLVDCIYGGMADAVMQYTRQRDAELRRQANDHFAFVAHELRSPLSAAQLAFTSLQNKGRLPSHALVKVLERGLARTRDLIEGTLSLSLAGSSVELRIERFDLGALIAEAVSDSALAAKERDILVRVHPHEPIAIEADRRLISSALTNVVGNAVKFSHRGGAVRVVCRAVEIGVAVDVEDQCGGLPAGAADKMFTAFVQVGKDRSGFGLGLAIAMQAVHAHGGSIHVHNREGDGCTITIELPRVAGGGTGG
jgi:signal transduction histidine kinase